jgi:ATP-dependent helicase YprA (DUF1998 family)
MAGAAGNISYPILDAARAAANISRQYSRVETRREISERFKTLFQGREPYAWQLDVAEALLLGLDCVTIAGTGAGKTMPFVMPLLVDKTEKKMVIIISPLNVLEYDQVSFRSSILLLLTDTTLSA